MSTLANFDFTLRNASGSEDRRVRVTGRLVYLGVRANGNNSYLPQVGLADVVVSRVSSHDFSTRVGFDISGDGAGTEYIGYQGDRTYYPEKSAYGAASVSWPDSASPYVSTSTTGTCVAAVRLEVYWGSIFDVYVKPITINVPNGYKYDCKISINFDSHINDIVRNTSGINGCYNYSGLTVYIPPNTTITLDAGVPILTGSTGGKVFRCWRIDNRTYSADAEISAAELGNPTYSISYYAWSIWDNPPQLSSVREIHRCNSSGTYDYDGSYCKVQVGWQMSNNGITTHFSEYDTISFVGRYREFKSDGSRGTYTSFSFSSGTTGTSGTASVVLGGLQTGKAYEFEVTVVDTASSPYQSHSTSAFTRLLLGCIFTGSNFSKSFSFDVTRGQNTVRFTGDLRYMGYFLWNSNLTNKGDAGFNDDYFYNSFKRGGHRFCVFQPRIEGVSGVECYAYFNFTDELFEDPDGSTHNYGIVNNVKSVDTNGLYVTVGQQSMFDNGSSLVEIADYGTFSYAENVFAKFWAFIKWSGDSRWTSFGTNYVMVSCPRYELSTARFVLYEQEGEKVGDDYHNVRPVGMACPKDSSITLTPWTPKEKWSNGSAEDVKFWHWNTTSNDTGYTYNDSEVVSWSSLASRVNTYSDKGGSISGVKLYPIWNPYIRFDRQAGYGNMPADWVKNYNVAFTLSSSVPTLAGFVFTSYNTASDGSGTSYLPSGTIPASQNTTLLLYPQWRPKTPPPTISSLTVVRCDANGNSNDVGTYCKVTASWSVNRTYDSGNTGTVTGVIRGDGNRSFSFSSGASGASGTAVAMISGISTDIQYTVDVTVTDSNTDNGHVSSVTKTVILTRAKFVMDLYRGGTGMGIGSAAPRDGLEIGWNTQVDGNLNVLGNITAANFGTVTTETDGDVVTTSGNISYSSAYGYKYGVLRMVAITFVSTNALTVGTNYTLGTLKSAYSLSKAMGFANQYGVGYVSGTTIYFKPLVSVSASTSLYVALTYIKP